MTTTTMIETAAELAQRIRNLKAQLAGADYSKRAALREEISHLDNHVYPAAVDRESKAAAAQRAAELATVESELTKAGQDLQPIAARRLELSKEIDYRVQFIAARDVDSTKKLAKVLNEIAGVWVEEKKLTAHVAELMRRRDELQDGE
jgi:hypothetical protein